jgi:glycosyltransferase involved in cell wall biosynthesis
MKNILFLHSSLNFSGGEKVTLMIASSLIEDENFNPIIGCYKSNTNFINEAKLRGIDVILMNICDISTSNPIKLLNSFLEIIFILIRNNIKLIQVVDPVAYRYIAIPSAFIKIPTVFHYHFPYSDEGLKWFFNRLPKPKVMLFCCNAIRHKMRKCLNVIASESKFLTIHNGIDTSTFTFSENRNIPPKNIAIVGNLQERKGHVDFLQMAAQLSNIENLRFHIIGDDVDGENRKSLLKKLCDELGILDKVIFHGFVKDVQIILAEMDILICASYEEAFPLNILEAMAIGLPVISTNVDGIPEAIVHEDNGFLVEPGNSKAMAGYVKLLINEPAVLNKVVKQAHRTIDIKFSKYIFGMNFKQFYDSIFEKK